MVIAFIKKNKFDEVMLALHKIEGLTGASNSEIHGFGHDRTQHVQDQEPEISLDFAPYIRLKIAYHSELGLGKYLISDKAVDGRTYTAQDNRHIGVIAIRRTK